MEMTLEQAENEYDIIRRHGKIHIRKYKGSGGFLVIPSLIDGMPVTKIEKYAFMSSGVTEVIIPCSIRYIAQSAFYFCRSLKKVTFSSKVYIEGGVFSFSGLEEISGIGYIAGADLDKYTFSNTPFYEKTDTFIVGDMLIWCHAETDTYTVPGHIRTIGYLAFYRSKIRNVILPEGLKEIRSLAFFGSGTECVNVPASVEIVGGNVFESSLKEITLPHNFGRRTGWKDPLGLSIPVIHDTQLVVDNDNDILEYEDVSCIICTNTIHNAATVRKKQIFPARLEYLKNVGLLSWAFTNVFRNDTFRVGENRKTFENDLIFFTQYKDSRRIFKLIFDTKEAYAEVLMYFPMLPFINGKNPHPGLVEFYNSCITNGTDGKFFDFAAYDGHILEQDIPFRLKAEIACERCTSNYRLSESALDGYRQYFQYHRKKLERLLKKYSSEKIQGFFHVFLE